jgi:glycosyltransferase involved in cell wall biosynthesis
MPIRKVLHVIPSVGPLRGGPSAMVRGLTDSLSREGVETHVATTNDNGPELLSVPCGVPVAQGGATYWYFPRQTRFYTVSWPLADWLAAHVSQFDLVHVHALFSFSTLPAAFWAHRRQVPYIVRPLGTLADWGMKNRRRWLKRLSFRFIESVVLKHAALVHYTSEQERAEAEALGVRTAAAIIPNAVPNHGGPYVAGEFRARYAALRDRRIVLFLSRLDPKKGLDLLLPAFAALRRQVPDVSLVIAGAGDADFVNGLKARAQSLGIAADVVWPGFLDGNDKRAALADADLFVLPSYSENFGIAAVEAMAAGLPLIVSDQVAIHREILQARAGLTVRCDVARLADALARLLADSTLRRSMGESGRALVARRYSSRAVTAELISVYNQIAAAPFITGRDVLQPADHPIGSH